MAKYPIVATFQIAAGKRDDYLKVLRAHAKRCLETEPGTLQFDILLPENEPDKVMLYEVYESPEAFQAHWNGASIKQARSEGQGLVVSLSGVRCQLVV